MKPIGAKYNNDVLAEMSFPSDVFLVDSTIRSLQSGVSGSTHDLEDLVEIGAAIDTLGVREQIINVSWRDGLEVIEALRSRGVTGRLVATFRARNPEAISFIEAAAAAGADEVCLESVFDPSHLRKLTAVAVENGVDVSHGFAEEFEDDELLAIIRAGQELGLKSQSFHDSFFHLAIGPEAMRHFIGMVRREVPDHPPLYVHLSNFFGHATMTAVAAMSAGASAADVCMNGSGHHCGHTSLGEVAMALRGLYAVDCGVATERLAEVADLVERHTSVPRRLDQPVVGRYAFLGDGAYWAAEADLPFEQRMHATFPVSPDTVGATEKVVWSDRTATVDAVRVRAAQCGQPDLSDADCRQVVEELRREIERDGAYPAWLDDERFEGLLRRSIGSVTGS